MTHFHPLLEGAIELHVHTSPSLFPRKQTDWEIVEDIKEAKMAGVLIKSHEAQTVDRATLIRTKKTGLHIYGGLVCNTFSGGFSPAAVDAAIRLGAKCIWMPTISAAAHMRYFAKKKTKILTSERPLLQSAQGMEVWDEHGKLLPEVHEILELIAEANIILATGHIAPQEAVAIVDAAKEHKVEKILIQHTDLGIVRIPFELEQEFVKKGAILEKCFLACSPDFEDITISEMAASIKQLGADACVLVTDYGQERNMPPVKAFNHFVEKMLEHGISEDDVQKMIRHNPQQLLGI